MGDAVLLLLLPNNECRGHCRLAAHSIMYECKPLLLLLPLLPQPLALGLVHRPVLRLAHRAAIPCHLAGCAALQLAFRD